MLKITDYKKHVEDYLNQTDDARIRAERRRDAVDNKQWTEEEEATLRARGQAPITVNRIAPKVDGLKGLLIQRRTDPKAFPRTQAHEDAARAATDALRYVSDNTDFDTTKLDVADDYFVEGSGGVVIRIERKGKSIETTIERVPWDRTYYDPYSRQHDYKDASYMGIMTWFDLVDAKAKYGAKFEEAMTSFEHDGDTFEDRPKWRQGSNDRRRVLIAEEFSLIGGVWHIATFTGETFLKDPEPSPFLDEDDNPMNPMELVCGHIDRNNQRFGDVEYWMDLQHEINHRRSKALHLNSSRQTISRNGAIDNVENMKRELKKPDGHVEYEGEKGDFDVIPTGDMAQAQLLMLQLATQEIDSVGFNAQLAGERQGNLSGKAINLLSNAGTNELASSFARLVQWENRVYRQVWARIRQFWTEEKWIRVTDEERNLRWVGFNAKITLQQRIEETINDKALPEFERKGAAQIFKQMLEAKDPRLQELVETRNDIAQLDMDIILEQSLDTINIQQEQFTLLATLAGNRPEIPFTALLRLSTLRDKDELIKKIEEGEQNAGRVVEAATAAEIEKARGLAAIATQVDQAKNKGQMERELMVGRQGVVSEEKIAAAKLLFEREKANLQMQVASHSGTVENSQTLKIPDADMIKAAMEKLAQANSQVAASNENDASAVESLIAELQRPLTIERDDNGRAVALV